MKTEDQRTWQLIRIVLMLAVGVVLVARERHIEQVKAAQARIERPLNPTTR